MAKNSKKRKNGKIKKYVPKPKGISKTKMKKIMDFLKEQKDSQGVQPLEIKEINNSEASEDFNKKTSEELSCEKSDADPAEDTKNE
jgi:predicted type IV restriction endonuclease